MSMNLGKTSLLGQDHDHQMNAKSIEIIDVENYNCTYNSILEIVNCEAEGNDSLNIHHQKTAKGFVPPPPQNVPMDSNEYQRYLKARLHFECAALASVRNKSINLGVSSKSGDPSHETWIEERANVLEQSPEADKVEAATTNKDSNYARSRRESAQRSRKRKAERISELEARVSKLEDENSNLLKQRVDDLQRHNQTLRDHALIKEQVAELRSQVYVLEEKLKNIPSRHISPALNCNMMACSSAQDNVLIRQYPSQANTLLSGHDRRQSSMTWPLIPNSNINDVNTSSSGHDHPQSSLANPPITDGNLDIDNDLDAWLKTASTLLSGHDRHQSSMTCPLIPNSSNINDVNASSGHDNRQSSLANPPITGGNLEDNDLDAWLKAQNNPHT